jgi:hypothetical protein
MPNEPVQSIDDEDARQPEPGQPFASRVAVTV